MKKREKREIKNGKLPDKPGNVFIANDVKADISWKDNNVLLVKYKTQGSTIYKQENEIYGLKIVYESR